MKPKVRRSRTAEHKQSRAALSTIEMAVAAVSDAIERLSTVQEHLYQAHRGALATFQAARQHPLKERGLHLTEHCAADLSKRLDWPAGAIVRTPHDHLERPLNDRESSEVMCWAASAFAITTGMLDISDMVEESYGTLVLTVARAARSALPRVTAEAHRKRAEELMFKLDQLCADERIMWAFQAGAAHKPNSPAGRMLAREIASEEDEDALSDCGPPSTRWLH